MNAPTPTPIGRAAGLAKTMLAITLVATPVIYSVADDAAQLFQRYPAPAEIQGQLFVGSGERRAYAGRPQKSLPRLAHELGFRIAGGCGGVLLIGPEPIADFHSMLVAAAYATTMQFAQLGRDRRRIFS